MSFSFPRTQSSARTPKSPQHVHITHIHTYTQAPTPSQTYTHAQSGHRLDEMKQSSGTAAHGSEDEGESRFHASESDVPHLVLTMS